MKNLFLSLMVVAFLASCGSNTTENTAPTTDSLQTEEAVAPAQVDTCNHEVAPAETTSTEASH